MSVTETCSWLHLKLESLPIITFPFDIGTLPERGIYFFYEEHENSDHGDGLKPRIVRIGTHKKANFRSRISEHFLVNKSRMNFNQYQPKPSDRSIFRKNIGRAILNRDKSNYFNIWEIDFTTRANRIERSHQRIIEYERKVEEQITKLLREKFFFRFISLEDEAVRIGSEGMESKLIGSVATCEICSSSPDWLGKFSPKAEICKGKLWLSQGLKSSGLNEKDKNLLESVIT
jgi:hypothetical protein